MRGEIRSRSNGMGFPNPSRGPVRPGCLFCSGHPALPIYFRPSSHPQVGCHWHPAPEPPGRPVRPAGSGTPSLPPLHRWAVTGTPLQNHLDDLYGLLAFLRLEPLDERVYFTRTLARPIKANDVRGLIKLQVGARGRGPGGHWGHKNIICGSV